jgi:hypothetical protein
MKACTCTPAQALKTLTVRSVQCRDQSIGWVRDAKTRRAFAIPVATGTDDTEITSLDKITMSDWLDREVGDRRGFAG